MDVSAARRETNFVETFKAFCQSSKLTADFLIVPGDITDRATPDQFQLASKQLANIAQGLGVSTDKILFVPGNHDVDWHILKDAKSDNSGLRRKQRYQPLCQENCIFSEIHKRKIAGDLVSDPYYCLWDFPEMLVVGQNSASHDNPDDTVHHGWVPSESLKTLDRVLTAIPHDPKKIRLAIVHHHPIQYSDPIPDEPDFSAMTNAEELLKVLAKHRFDLLIHGHKHKPNFNLHMVDSHFRIPILGAGSFSYSLDSRWSGMVNNQFHRIEVHDRDRSTGLLRGILRNYTYLCGHGWKNSQASNGIDSMVFFGGYASDDQLKGALRLEIGREFSQADYVDWTSVVERNRDLSYIPHRQLISAFRSLETELNFVMFDSDPGRILLLRQKRAQV